MSNFKTLINQIVDGYIKNTRFCNILIGSIRSIEPLTINISSEKFLPLDFFTFSSKTSYLKNTQNNQLIGDKLIMVQATGGQKYIVLDKYEDIATGSSVSVIERISPLKIRLANGKIINQYMIFSKGLESLRNATDTSLIGKKLITMKETGTDNYIFIAESE